MSNSYGRFASLLGVMIVASLLFGVSTTKKASAQQVSGNAPFINSWLVSGPFESPVIDKQYECEADDSKAPVDGKTEIAPKAGGSLSFGNESRKWEPRV
ncbi:hypothetical protein [Streptomyces sp. NPDC001948]